MIITPLFVLFLVIVFTLILLFMNTIDKRKWITIPLSIVITPFVYFYAFYPMLNIFSSYHHEKYFNTKVWLSNPGFRYEMFDNVMETDTLMGKSKETVTELLGTYEWLSWDDANNGHDENKWNYGLGVLPGAFNSKSEAVEIVFENNKVSQLNHYQQAIKFDAKE